METIKPVPDVGDSPFPANGRDRIGRKLPNPRQLLVLPRQITETRNSNMTLTATPKTSVWGITGNPVIRDTAMGKKVIQGTRTASWDPQDH